MSVPPVTLADVHRIGGGTVDNLRLKPPELLLKPPGISVLKAAYPQHVVDQVKAAFPNASRLHRAARVVGSITEEAIRNAGFDLLPDPTRRFPNHYRIVHPQEGSGFIEVNLNRLAQAFIDTELES